MAMLDLEGGRLNQCPECGRYWRATTSTHASAIYCPTTGYVSERGCAERVAERKSRQRKSWDRFLNSEFPSHYHKFPKNRHGRAEHPHNLLQQGTWDLQAEKVQRLAIKWAKRNNKHSAGKPDHLIDWLLQGEPM
jgi:hypothetical protein